MIPNLRQDGISTKELAESLDVTEKTLRQWRSRGKGPPWIALEGRVVYLRSEVSAWFAARRRSGKRNIGV